MPLLPELAWLLGALAAVSTRGRYTIALRSLRSGAFAAELAIARRAVTARTLGSGRPFGTNHGRFRTVCRQRRRSRSRLNRFLVDGVIGSRWNDGFGLAVKHCDRRRSGLGHISGRGWCFDRLSGLLSGTCGPGSWSRFCCLVDRRDEVLFVRQGNPSRK
jgi:hypothetical protein